MFRVFRRKADAARPARKQSFAQRGGWNLNVGCPAMTSTGYMTALGRKLPFNPLVPPLAAKRIHLKLKRSEFPLTLPITRMLHVSPYVDQWVHGETGSGPESGCAQGA